MRLALGLEQVEMASLLGISRGLLSMVESEKRALPVFALLRFNTINHLLEMYEDEILETNLTLPLEKLQAILARYRVVRINLMESGKKLEEKLRRSKRLNTMLSHFDELISPDYKPEKDRLWKNTIENSMTGDETKELEQELFLLRLRIETMDWKIKKLEAEIEK